MVFIAGLRQITRLPAEVKVRVDTMIDRGFQILVGDANGADKAVQTYLAEKVYPHVLVHCMERHCRTNVGHWPTHEVAAQKGARGFDFYSAKDRVMADAAECASRRIDPVGAFGASDEPPRRSGVGEAPALTLRSRRGR
jgi:hypothetical protein